MVVLSAAVMSKQAPLVARQFVEITKIRMEGLLSAFLKLVESGGKDHTYIETESVRYVYQPMESLYLLLITNKTSNILEDLDTLRLLQQCVQMNCHLTPVLPEHIVEKAFDIVFAFDEVISFGYRESVTLSQIRTFTEMESHEEKLQDMIRKSKEQEEADRRRQIATKLDKEHALKKREERERSRAAVAAEFDSLTTPPRVIEPTTTTATIASETYTATPATSAAAAPGTAPRRGMQLGKKPASEILESLQPLGGAAAISGAGSSAGIAESAEEESRGIVNPLLEPVSLTIEEKVTAALMSEGGVTELDVQGQLKVTILDPARAGLANFKITGSDQRFRFSVHPSLNKAAHAKGLLELADPSKPFKPNVSVPLLKWRPASKTALASDGAFPLNVNCWPSATKDGTSLTVEVELLDTDFALNDVKLRFPLPKSGPVDVQSLQGGETKTDGQFLLWELPLMDASFSQATLEFQAKGDASAFFPVNFEGRTATSKICHIEVTDCFHQQRQDALQYAVERSCVLEGVVSM